ncbi:protein-tyrosine phosphatase [Paenibacillus polysaccharolyticus]|uniref:Tyrosine-protein phosphatase n=1 Tax=Paenibacillus polysaccharolyticus TaxID=582692 RepID=A0A1G5GCF8_9BACL|nr:CpsB/CapC family capsule biosynthesis tyrosine phosphatase [Paenibacillus polysaccharolyticus]SCY49204.1 protein-tyrosine phosphatase [Paenibacillus polysaccharolyticus]
MVEMHCHILFGLDDGPVQMEQSVAMAEKAVASGITSIIATPHHLNGHYNNEPKVVNQAVYMFRAELAKRNIRLQIDPGQEIRVHDRLIEDLYAGKCCTLAGSRYMLLELPFGHIPSQFPGILHELRIAGITPIIAHPERNLVILKKPLLLSEYLFQGGLCQLTAESFTGLFGRKVQKWCFHFCKENGFHFISSDAHDTKYRTFKLDVVYPLLERRLGRCCIQHFQDNAQSIWNNQRISAVLPAKKKRSFLFW